MNKLLKTLIGSFLISIATLYINTSCSDSFLEEKMVGDLTTQFFDTEAGLDALSIAAYEGLRHYHSEEHAYAMTNYGTDEFQVGGGPDYRFMNDYTGITSVDPKVHFSGLSFWWDTLYGHINTVNMVLRQVDLLLSPSDPRYNQYKGEAYFLRGYHFFRLVNQYGGIVLKLTPSEGVETEFTRSTTAESFKQIIEDLENAAELLPATSTDGHITKAAAYHFLAKVHLFRASELHADITEPTDLDNAVKYGLKVINKEDGTDRELAEDYHDFWNFLEEGVNGLAEQNKEIILAAQYSDDNEKKNRLTNRTHLYFIPRYEDGMTGMQRVKQYGRPYQRCRPTDYTYDVYDRVNDSRFWKSFRTLYKSTNKGTGEDFNGKKQEHIIGLTDGIKIIVNNKGDKSFDYHDYMNVDEKDGQKVVSHKVTFPTYWVREFANGETSFAVSKFAGLDKYLDPHRTGNQNDINGTRDGFLARIGETYLIVAEAYGRKGDYGNAVKYINILRERAAYREGEDRGHYRNQGETSYFSANTYYESNGIDEGITNSTLNAMKVSEADFDKDSDAGIPYSIFGATTKEDKFLHFILNERTRELCGEFHRWEDLSRTKTLYIRTIPYNLDNAAEQLKVETTGKFFLRPIPQTFIDGVTINGNTPNTEQGKAMQNPGY